MAETSGFFQSVWDDSLVNPTTGESTGWWDRNYIASQFANFFALFVGNGVFGSPTNQLKVIPGTGLNVVVSAGWAFINGNWYHNDSNKILAITANNSGTQRTDSVKVRLDQTNRRILVDVFTGETSVQRTSTIYDLKLANIVVRSGATSISASNITDTRTNENVCGLVKGLMEVETTADLFAQYQSQFNDWFDDIKDQLVGDLAVRLQLEFDELNSNVDAYYENTGTQIEQYEEQISEQISGYQSNTQSQISGYQNNVSSQISGYNTNYQQTLTAAQTAAQTAQSQVTNYVDKDYVIAEQAFTFTNKVCTINDAKVTANSLIDVYFTAETIGVAEEAQIYVDSSAGRITLTALNTPTGTIRGMIRVRVRS